MLLIPTQVLKPGMTLAQPIYHPLAESCMLLNKGVEVRADYIAKLNELGVTNVWIHFEGLEAPEGATTESISAEHMHLYEAINSSIDHLERRVEVKLNLHQYRKAVHSMLAGIVENPHHNVVTHQLASCGSMLTGHMANCCYLSLLVGAHMTGYLKNERSTLPADVAENTSELGVGTLLHDIGKLQMPEEMQSKSVLDPEEDWPEYRYHVRAGYDEAREHVSVVASNTIYNHHQRYDGSGFPRRKARRSGECAEPLAGRQIHIFSRILAVVDAFDHLLCPAGTPVPTIIAIHGLKSTRFDGWFDPVVTETLLRLVPPFQVGCLVILSDGKQAVVVRNHPEAPCRPLVRLVRGQVGDASARAEVRQLDLRMCRNLSVAVVGNVDIRDYVFTGELEPV